MIEKIMTPCCAVLSQRDYLRDASYKAWPLNLYFILFYKTVSKKRSKDGNYIYLKINSELYNK